MCARVHPGDRVNDFAGSDQQDRPRNHRLLSCLGCLGGRNRGVGPSTDHWSGTFGRHPALGMAAVRGHTRYDTSR